MPIDFTARVVIRKSQIANGFTLVEMLTTVAVLIIALGLMVSLARYVRDRSAQLLTRNLLRQLDLLVVEYSDNNAGQLPVVTSLMPDAVQAVDEQTVQARARQNNEDLVRALRAEIARALVRRRTARQDQSARLLEDLPLSAYDEVSLRDAWGGAIVFLPTEHRAIGMAPRGRPSFFFSAGPDGKYLTRDDNLYSYEASGAPAPP